MHQVNRWTYALIEALHAVDVKRILDLEFGYGNEVRAIEKEGFFVTGPDHS